MIKKEHAERIYGRLYEAAHISGYAFEHLCKELETLIDTNQWQTIGPGYTRFSDFIRTIDLSKFNFERPQRKRLAKKMSKAGASNCAIADVIGVSESTVRSDTSRNHECRNRDTKLKNGSDSQKNESGMSVHYSSDTDEWATPEILYKALNREFKFNLDVCATAKNAKCRRFLIRPKMVFRNNGVADVS